MEPQAAEVGSGFLESWSRSVKSLSGEQKALEKWEPLARSRPQSPGSMYKQGVLELELSNRRKSAAPVPRLGKFSGCDLSILAIVATCSYYVLGLGRKTPPYTCTRDGPISRSKPRVCQLHFRLQLRHGGKGEREDDECMHAVPRKKYNTQVEIMRQEPPTNKERQNHESRK